MNKLLFWLLAFLLTGCAPAVVPLPIPQTGDLTSLSLATIKSTGPVAVAANGSLLAWSDSALTLYDLATGQQKVLFKKAVDALCWSPDGRYLAAVSTHENQSRLQVYDSRGQRVFEAGFAGRVVRLIWPQQNQLLAGALTYKSYRFGTHIKGRLIEWDQQWRQSEVPLFETTIKPSTAKRLAGQLYKTFDFDLSPLADEVLYTRLYAPPAFEARRYLILHNLQTKEEKRIGVLPLLRGKGRLTREGESVFVSDGLQRIKRLNLWSLKVQHQWAGNTFAYDAGSDLLATETGLYRGQQLLSPLPAGSLTEFSTGGKYLSVIWNRHLYLVSGYPVPVEPAITGVKREKLQKLRRLRSRKLIEPEEYLQARKRLLQ